MMPSLEETICDREWRLSNLYYIVDKNGEKILFRRNHIQQKIKDSIANRKMILKARQFGVTTFCLLEMLDDTMFNTNTTSAVIAHNANAVMKLFRIIRRAYDFFDPSFRPEIGRGGGSMSELYFPEINSRIYAGMEIRGDTIQRLHVSEAAFMKDDSKLKASLQAVPIETGKVTIETTANGLGNHFYDMWSDTEQPYDKMFFPWFIYPDYKLRVTKLDPTDEELEMMSRAKKNFGVEITKEQLAFRRLKKAELKVTNTDGIQVTFEQEYPEDEQTCFLSSGQAKFDLLMIKRKIDESKDPISNKDGIKIYEEMKKDKLYVCGADTAEGVNGDFSVGVMIEVQSRKIVAICRSNRWKPSEFASMLNILCNMYKPPSRGHPLLAVERNNHGHAVLQSLDETIGYQNIYRHTDEKLGWRTDLVTRPIMMNAFVDAVENNYLDIPDKTILNECLTLVNNQGKIEAADNKHDDCIVATAIALQMVLGSSNLSIYDNIENRILI